VTVPGEAVTIPGELVTFVRENAMAMDEYLGHIVKIEEEEGADQDALDAALEMELAATYMKYPVVNIPYPFDVVAVFVMLVPLHHGNGV